MCASASLGFANLAVHILNRVIQFNPWPRPFEVHESAARAAEIIFYMPQDPSFPANIAAITFGAAMGMWIYSRKASRPLFLLAVVWCFARVYAGVHYPLDIIGGAVIGAIIAWGTYGVMQVLWPFPSACLWVAKKLYVA
ncbi:MAG: phosphatase PAP2 family protein [Chloroflexota bacterium]